MSYQQLLKANVISALWSGDSEKRCLKMDKITEPDKSRQIFKEGDSVWKE